MKKDTLRSIIKEELHKALTEDVTLAKEDKNGRVFIRGIEYLIKKHPDLEPLVDSMLADKGKYNIGDLSVDDVMALNLQIQSSIRSQAEEPNEKPSQDEPKMNPYDMPGYISKGYMGSSYTGD
jgi:hypothetical protein